MFDHSGQQIVILDFLVVEKGGERLAVNKQRKQRFHMNGLNFKN
jgi:hypothetical protein